SHHETNNKDLHHDISHPGYAKPNCELKRRRPHPGSRHLHGTNMTIRERLVLKRQPHLKWHALDPLETMLMMLCGLLLFGFCSTAILDIITREIGRPWLWLQEVTSTFFIYAIFTGTAVATRRSDHLYLTAVA